MNADGIAIDAEAVAAAALGWIGQALLFGSVLAGLTWVLLLFLRPRRTPTLEIALWSIVLIKFLVPIGPGWSFSLASISERLTSQATSRVAGAGEAEGDRPLDVLPTATAGDPGAAAASALPSVPWATIIVAAYLAGVIGLAIARARSYRAFRRRCLAFPVAAHATRELVQLVCRRLGVRRAPLIRISTEPQTAFVMGFIRPLLVLSRDYLVRPDEVETVVVHEVTHLRRGDMLVRCLQCVAGIVLFFWPVVAWVNRRIDWAREHACDEWALRHGRLTASEYAWCLLNAVRPVRSHRLTYQPACMAGKPSTIERRIDVILELPSRPVRRPVWGLLTAALLVAWGGFTLTGVAQAQHEKKTVSDEYAPTEESMRAHAAEVYARVNEYAAGDQDGDGKVTKEECWVFITAVAMLQPELTLERYPKADRDQDGTLTLMEAHEYFRGDYDLAGLEKKVKIKMESALKDGDEAQAQELKLSMKAKEYMVWHVILDRRAKMLDEMTDQPSADMVAAIAEKVAKIEAKKKKASEGDKLSYAIQEVFQLEQKAATLRAKAAEIGGDEAADYEAKADQLEEKAAQLRIKVATVLEEQIEKLEAAGDQKKADQLKAKLAELEIE